SPRKNLATRKHGGQSIMTDNPVELDEHRGMVKDERHIEWARCHQLPVQYRRLPVERVHVDASMLSALPPSARRRDRLVIGDAGAGKAGPGGRLRSSDRLGGRLESHAPSLLRRRLGPRL